MTTALVPAVPRCPHDGWELIRGRYEQLPLPMLHGGYGHGTATETLTCPACGYAREVSTTPTRPPRRG